tara:strand:+ start:197 stop:337 length:141 start_codon:yes stop_codon:yes gene_type:complete
MDNCKRNASDRRANDRRMSDVSVEYERRNNQRRSGVDRREALNAQV